MTWQKAEQTVARISFVIACFGLVEKILHYVGVFKRTYHKKTKSKPFGFYPESKKKGRWRGNGGRPI